MRRALIRISEANAAGFPVELFNLSSGTEVSIAAGVIQPGTIDAPGAAAALAGATPPAGLNKAGRAIYDALFNALADRLQQWLDGPESAIFLDVKPGGFQNLPWEIMVWPKTIPGGVAESRVTSAHHLARVYQPDWNRTSSAPEGPLRILFAIGSADSDPDVAACEELEEIERNIRPVHPAMYYEVVENHPDLYPKIIEFSPHVLHFIGHGFANPPRLQFDKKAAPAAWDWTTAAIATDVGNFNLKGWVPNLAFLNACRTGSAAGELGPVAGAFLGAGAWATIAMQGNIKGRAAGLLAGVFYRELGNGATLELALSVARGEVARQFGEKEAAYPALSVRCQPAAVLPAFSKPDPRHKTCPYLKKLSLFVNQKVPRREVYQNLWPGSGNARVNFILIRGRSGFGKTVLSTCLLQLSASLGHHVRYIQVSRVPLDFVRILDAIWGVSDPPNLARISPLFEPLPLQPQAELRELIDKSKDPLALYSKFRQALAEVSRNRPITIVLDEFERKLDEGSFWTMWEHLITNLSLPELDKVTLVLVLSEDDCTYYKLDEKLRDHLELVVPKHDVPLNEMGQSEVLDLLDRYLSYRSPYFDVGLRQNIRLLKGLANIDPPLAINKLELKAVELARALNTTLP
jgi:hypothetical protein